MKNELNIEKMREEFDSWLRSQPHVLNVGFDKVTGKYLLEEDETAWQAWQASRAAIEVELPGSFWQDYVNKNEVMDADRVIEAIESIGLKVAP